MEYDKLEKLARGRVYTGAMAIKIGLVDELGTLDDAVKYAAKSPVCPRTKRVERWILPPRDESARGTLRLQRCRRRGIGPVHRRHDSHIGPTLPGTGPAAAKRNDRKSARPRVAVDIDAVPNSGALIGATESVEIRTAEPGDLEAITEIYNEAILTTTATFDVEPKTLADRRDWFQKHGGRYPILVAVVADRVVGWASLSRFSERSAYDETAETSFYVESSLRGRGIGRAQGGDYRRSAPQRFPHAFGSRR